MEADAEHALTADGTRIRQNLAARYGIPADLLLPATDPLVRVVDDHVLFPFSEAWSHRRWTRVSSLKILKRVCFKARRVLEDKTLMLYIMPYLSLEDASIIHGLIENRGEIRVQDMTGTNKEPGSGHLKLPMQGRHGVLMVDDPDRSHDPAPPFLVKFFVINYGLLASKAREHSRLAGLIHEASDLVNNVNLHMSGLLNGQSLSRVQHPNYIQKIEDNCRIAQEELILSLYNNDEDPHDAIADIDTDVHDYIYGDDCDSCNSSNAPSSKEIPEDVSTRLHDYMNELISSGRHVCNPKDAKCEVLAAEGSYDAESVFSRASNSLKKTLDECNKGLYDLISELTAAGCRSSLIGVQGKRAAVVQNPQVGD
ncbi:unnamed protein product [Urochloa humidicola]